MPKPTLKKRGVLRISAAFGFDSTHVVRAISEFSQSHPELELQLTLTDGPIQFSDVPHHVWFADGSILDRGFVARKIASNRRFLWASPQYLEKATAPKTPHCLQSHECFVVVASDSPNGSWHLRRGRRHETVCVKGKLRGNNDEMTLRWALDGHGIALLTERDASKHFSSGTLKIVLPEWLPPPAEIYAIYSEKLASSIDVTEFVDFVAEWFDISINFRIPNPNKR